jgi:hypothetical protein
VIGCVCSIEQFADPDTEGLRDLDDVDQGRIPSPLLDTPDVRAVQPTEVRQLLLGQTFPLAEAADSLTEGLLEGIVHGGQLNVVEDSCPLTMSNVLPGVVDPYSMYVCREEGAIPLFSLAPNVDDE